MRRATLSDRWAPCGAENVPPPLEMPSDDERRPRTEEEMAAEASAYASAAAGGGALPTTPVQFGKFALKPSQVFWSSASGETQAFVNLKPLVPGHVLVTPRRVVARTSELTAAEIRELWRSVREVQRIVATHHGATACNLGLQDGRDSGQSVPHVHVHVLPRPEAEPVGGGAGATSGGWRASAWRALRGIAAN